MDPEATLRRTVAYGGMVVLLTLTFEGMENVAAGWVVAAAGLPGSAAVWISSGVTGLVLGAFHRRIERWTERALAPRESVSGEVGEVG